MKINLFQLPFLGLNLHAINMWFHHINCFGKFYETAVIPSALSNPTRGEPGDYRIHWNFL